MNILVLLSGTANRKEEQAGTLPEEGQVYTGPYMQNIIGKVKNELM